MSNTTNESSPFVDPNRLPNGETPRSLSSKGYRVDGDGDHTGVHSSAATNASLQARVDALAQSVGAPKQNTLHPGYDPDLFLEALKQRHDALAMITDRLEKRHEEQEQRQRDLDVREKQVSFREKRIAAHERLSDKSKWRLW